MAKGNTGNLLQHFVAVTCAERLVAAWNKPDEAIEYIDCYSMCPWEQIEDHKWRSGSENVRGLDDLARRGDLVARAFHDSWQSYYVGSHLPDDPCRRMYPNTAVLLAAGFPHQRWSMRLHDIKDVARRDLAAWFNRNTKCCCRVEANWTQSPLLQRHPIGPERPLLLMLDPYKIIKEYQIDTQRKVDVDYGYLPQNWLRPLLGSLYLGLNELTASGKNAPIILTLFSYADANPGDADDVVRAVLAKGKWIIERVQTKPYQLFSHQVVDQAWVVSSGLQAPIVAPSMQVAWNAWIT